MESPQYRNLGVTTSARLLSYKAKKLGFWIKLALFKNQIVDVGPILRFNLVFI